MDGSQVLKREKVKKMGMTLEKRFIATLKKLNITDGNTCLLALSGGGDSVALTVLAARAANIMALSLQAVRVTHGIRTEAEEAVETRLCHTLCQSLNIPFIDLSLPPGRVESVKKRFHCGTEQAARYCRQSEIENYRRTIGANCILYGHTADDQLETVLMRLLSGSGPEGLKGIPEMRGRQARPLLRERRQVLMDWLNSHNISWADDESNISGRFRRNRIRNELIPLISDIMPGWDKAVFTLAERSREVRQSLKDLQDECIPVDWQTASFQFADWNAAPAYLKAMTLWDIINRFNRSDIPDRRIPWSAIVDARRKFNDSGTFSGYGIILERSGKTCSARFIDSFIDRKTGQARFVIEKTVFSDGQVREINLAIGPWRVRASLDPLEGAYAFAIDCNDWPLILGVYKDGESDKIILKGRGKLLDSDPEKSLYNEYIYIACSRHIS